MQPVSEQHRRSTTSLLILMQLVVSLLLGACDVFRQETRPFGRGAGEFGGSRTTQIDVGDRAGELQMAGGQVWVMVNPAGVDEIDKDGAGIVRIDPQTDKLTGRKISLGELGVDHPGGFDVGHGSIWALSVTLLEGAWDKKPGELIKVDPGTGRLIARTAVGLHPSDVTVAYGAVWVTNIGDDTLLRIDPETMDVEQTIQVGDGPGSVLSAFGSIWVDNEFGTTSVMRIDPETGRILATIQGVARPAPGVGVLWVAGPGGLNGDIRRIDPRTNQFVGPTFPLDIAPAYVAGGKSSVWIGRWDPTASGNYDPHSSGVFKYRQYDPEENVLVGPEVIVLEPLDAWVGFGSLWVPHPNGPVVLRAPES